MSKKFLIMLFVVCFAIAGVFFFYSVRNSEEVGAENRVQQETGDNGPEPDESPSDGSGWLGLSTKGEVIGTVIVAGLLYLVYSPDKANKRPKNILKRLFGKSAADYLSGLHDFDKQDKQ